MVTGAVFNVLGRGLLKSNWANQIKIYEGHWLVTQRPVRRGAPPALRLADLDGSWRLANLRESRSLILALGAFVPMMYVSCEEGGRLLEEAFGPAVRRVSPPHGHASPTTAGVTHGIRDPSSGNAFIFCR